MEKARFVFLLICNQHQNKSNDVRLSAFDVLIECMVMLVCVLTRGLLVGVTLEVWSVWGTWSLRPNTVKETMALASLMAGSMLRIQMRNHL